ncbi:MAG: aminoacyl--tRNA ligase-related protein [Actinomycetota bacterium]
MKGSLTYRSKTFMPTEREAPADAVQPSHKFMVRAGMIRQLGSGAYSKLPLGFDVTRRLETIIDEEMENRGASRLHFPALQPVSIWKEAGRFEIYGDDMFHFPDRHGRETCLAPTHEIAAALLATSDIRSYKDLPCRLYQTQIKFRDEARPRGGVLRTREFTMHDLYSFDEDEEKAQVSYSLFHEAYVAVFRRVDLPVFSIETSETGTIGGAVSHEFLHPNDLGESSFWVTADGKEAFFEPAGKSDLVRTSGFELAHTFQLATQYSEALSAKFNRPTGERLPVWMCSFGLGIERTIAAAIEHHARGSRMVWPVELAPYHVNVILASEDLASEAHREIAELGAHLLAAGLRVMVDDRQLRIGAKFADSELLGPRWELVVGKEYPFVELRDHAEATEKLVNISAAPSEVLIEARRGTFT